MDPYHNTIVKIISHNVTHDWYAPFRSPYENESIGTGFFFLKGGYILTCCHVVEDAIKLEITIPLEGKTRYSAKVISMSPDYDIAVIKAEYKNNSVLELLDSDLVKQGEQVRAVGYPLGQDKLKLSQGIISGYQNYHFQTDAPINPGNSGGPLVDDNNNVIAINSQKISADMADNIGYSVPIKYFNILYDSFLPADESKPVIIRRPQLLCTFSTINNIMKEYNNIKNDGYLITEIHEKSCLYKGGLRIHDILMEFDIFKLDKYGEVDVPWNNEKFNIDDILYRFKIGDNIKIKYFNKDDGEKTITIKLDYPDFVIEDIYLNLFKQRIDYEIISGLVFCNFKRNHLYKHQILPQTNLNSSTKHKLLDYKDNYEKRFDSKIILVSVLPGSYSNSNNTIDAGLFLETINDEHVSNLNDLRKIIRKYVNTSKFIKLSFKTNDLVVLTYDNIKEQHKLLCQQYNYPKTPLFEFLLGSYSINYQSNKKPKTPKTPKTPKFLLGSYSIYYQIKT